MTASPADAGSPSAGAETSGADRTIDSITVDDPEWCSGCGQKHSKCECVPSPEDTVEPDETCADFRSLLVPVEGHTVVCPTHGCLVLDNANAIAAHRSAHPTPPAVRTDCTGVHDGDGCDCPPDLERDEQADERCACRGHQHFALEPFGCIVGWDSDEPNNWDRVCGCKASSPVVPASLSQHRRVAVQTGGSVDDVPVSDTAMRERVARVIGTWVRTGSLDKAADELLAVVRPGERYDDLCVCGHIRNTHGPGCDRCYDEMSGGAGCATFRPVVRLKDDADGGLRQRIEALVTHWAAGDFVSHGYAVDLRRALDGAEDGEQRG